MLTRPDWAPVVGGSGLSSTITMPIWLLGLLLIGAVTTYSRASSRV